MICHRIKIHIGKILSVPYFVGGLSIPHASEKSSLINFGKFDQVHFFSWDVCTNIN